MDINYGQIVKEMLDAMKSILSDHWKEAKPYAEKELKSFAENIKLIAKLKAEDKITLEQAQLYIEIQRSTMRVVLLTIEGLGILAVEKAINTAIDTVRKTINTAIGWKIL